MDRFAKFKVLQRTPELISGAHYMLKRLNTVYAVYTMLKKYTVTTDVTKYVDVSRVPKKRPNTESLPPHVVSFTY